MLKKIIPIDTQENINNRVKKYNWLILIVYFIMYYLTLILNITLGFILFLIIACGVFRLWAGLDTLGKTGRAVPITTTIILFSIGIMLYLTLVQFSTIDLAKEYPYLSNNPGMINLQKLVKLKFLDNPTIIISIILTPYFWVLWIWRHNDKEHAKSREIQIDDTNEFDRILDMISSDSESILASGIYRLNNFLKSFEDEMLKSTAESFAYKKNKDKYSEYCNQAICALVNNTENRLEDKEENTPRGDNYDSSFYHYEKRIKEIALVEAIFLQEKHVKLIKEKAQHSIPLSWVRKRSLSEFAADSVEHPEKLLVFGFAIDINDLNRISKDSSFFRNDKWQIGFSHSFITYRTDSNEKIIQLLEDSTMLIQSEIIIGRGELQNDNFNVNIKPKLDNNKELSMKIIG